MSQYNIKNVIFDVGNVIVQWSPLKIVQQTFPDLGCPHEFVRRLFGTDVWQKLNLGQISEKDAKREIVHKMALSDETVQQLFENAKSSLVLIEGTQELMQRLLDASYRLFALTDNVRETVAYLERTYSFWNSFENRVVSAEIGLMKPDPAIYKHSLDKFSIEANETIFLDDLLKNVIGARDMGIHAIQFINAQQCENELKQYGLKF